MANLPDKQYGYISRRKPDSRTHTGIMTAVGVLGILGVGTIIGRSSSENGQEFKVGDRTVTPDRTTLVQPEEQQPVQIGGINILVNVGDITIGKPNRSPQTDEITQPTETPTSGDGGKNKPEQSPSVTPTETQPTATATETQTSTPDATAITAETPRTVEDFKGKVLHLDSLAETPLVLSNLFPGRVKFYTKDKRGRIIPYGGLTAIGTHRSIESLNIPYTDFYDYGSGNSVIVFGSNDNGKMTQDQRDRLYKGDLRGNSLHPNGYWTLSTLGYASESTDPNQEIKVLILNHS